MFFSRSEVVFQVDLSYCNRPWFGRSEAMASPLRRVDLGVGGLAPPWWSPPRTGEGSVGGVRRGEPNCPGE
jgi:hypothetical protein